MRLRWMVDAPGMPGDPKAAGKTGDDEEREHPRCGESAVALELEQPVPRKIEERERDAEHRSGKHGAPQRPVVRTHFEKPEENESENGCAGCAQNGGSGKNGVGVDGFHTPGVF